MEVSSYKNVRLGRLNMDLGIWPVRLLKLRSLQKNITNIKQEVYDLNPIIKLKIKEDLE